VILLRSWLTVVAVAALVPACAASAGAMGQTSSPAFGFSATRLTTPVRSLQEIRESQLVRQSWDLSCGSAALSTLLTHDLKDPTTEAAVIVWLLQRTDPVKIQSRGGFSLLDLKRFAESRGYVAEGYAGLTLQDLVRLGPAIVPIRAKGYDHFVVVRDLIGDRVVYADPAFGNLTRSIERFQEVWASGIGFVVYPREVSARPRQVPLPDDLLVPDATFAYRQLDVGRVAGPSRRPR
jgi:predicted double-glycine peptidase